MSGELGFARGLLLGLFCGFGGGTLLGDAALLLFLGDSCGFFRGLGGFNALLLLLPMAFAFGQLLGGEGTAADEVSDCHEQRAETNHRQ